ncbi:MAG TPA: hypothetical protein VMT95_01420 [Candidatus Binatia bacterium]|nr:hypothetical protein [Candidatus Binatia bacterium]
MKTMLRTTATLAGLATIFTLGIHTPASAQQQPTPCGYWSEGEWVPEPCQARPHHAAISGTIVGVSANRLTVQTGPMQTVVVNDEPALNAQDTGRIYTGRMITAYGYWNGGEFVATSIA